MTKNERSARYRRKARADAIAAKSRGVTPEQIVVEE
jgi:hypothetical protein